MCHPSCITFGTRNFSEKEIEGKRVIDVGALDVNGSYKPFIMQMNPSEYVGVDICIGGCVDILCYAENMVEAFGKESFDVVISTEMLEHVENWKKAISNIKNICKTNGIILITTRSIGMPYHPFPADFWRFELDDMRNIFSDCRILILEKDIELPGIFIKVVKPDNFIEKDLSSFEVYNIAQNKIIERKTQNNIETNTKMGIGISTINDYLSTDNLLTSIITKTDGIKDRDYTILVVDDGTQDTKVISNLENVCQKHKVHLIHNEQNRGVPYTWNKLAQNLNTELITIFNNDITVQEPNWLKVIQQFLTQNNKIGAVGFPLLQREGTSQHVTGSFNDTTPRLVAAVSGAAFGFKKSVFDKVINPDNSIGFYEEYISFLEETHFCFKLIELGYKNYMLNWPLMIHDTSTTLRKNPELWFRTVDWSRIEKQINGSKNEFISTIKNSKMYPEDYKIDNRIIYNITNNHQQTDNNNKQTEKVNRLQFSRYMFSKYWKISHDDLFVDPNKYASKNKNIDRIMTEIANN